MFHLTSAKRGGGIYRVASAKNSNNNIFRFCLGHTTHLGLSPRFSRFNFLFRLNHIMRVSNVSNLITAQNRSLVMSQRALGRGRQGL